QPSDLVDRCFGQDAVTQVEDVSESVRGLVEHASGFALEHLRGGEERQWVKITHHPDLLAQLAPGAAQVDPPVESDHASPGVAEVPQEAPRIGAEVDYRHARREPTDEGPGVR